MNTNNNNITQSMAMKNDILEGKREFLSLDFNDPLDYEVALDLIKERESYVYFLNGDDETQIKLILAWIALAKSRDEIYSRTIKLLKTQLNRNVLDYYLYEKFVEAQDSFNKTLDVYRGFTANVILSYDYETKEGETLCYFDRCLGVPTKLRVSANFKLILVDSLKLIRKLNVNVSSITVDYIMNLVNNSLNTVLRDTILKLIEDENLSYYQLSRNYTMFSNAIFENAKEIFADAGIEMSEISIRDIAISNNAGKMLEEQYFAIAEAERVKEFENRVEQASLALYEKKAQIHEKYPKFPVSLTEAEKDFAFDRYMKRENKGKIYSTKLDEIKLAMRERPDLVPKPDRSDIVVPKEPLAPRVLKGLIPYCILFALFVIAGILATIYVEPKLIGYIFLLATVVVFGAIGIVLFCIANKNKKLYPTKKEYKQMYEEYQRELQLYHEKQTENIYSESNY